MFNVVLLLLRPHVGLARSRRRRRWVCSPRPRRCWWPWSRIQWRSRSASGSWRRSSSGSVGRAVARQERLVVELEETRRELAQQALLADRRRIARDVHDFVGHGLAAGDAAGDERPARAAPRCGGCGGGAAIRGGGGPASTKNFVGRWRYSDRDDEAGRCSACPHRRARSRRSSRRHGQEVSRSSCRREPRPVADPARRRAWRCTGSRRRRWRTRLATPRVRGRCSGSSWHTDESRSWRRPADPSSQDPPPERGRPHYGLIGMQERATALGGEFAAGPTRDGWRVRCELPVERRGNSVIRVAIVDDQAIVRAGLARILSPADGFEVVAECADGRQAVEELPGLGPDVVLMDVRMPGSGRHRRDREVARPSMTRSTCSCSRRSARMKSCGARSRQAQPGFVLKDSTGGGPDRGCVELWPAGRPGSIPVVARCVLLERYRRVVAPDGDTEPFGGSSTSEASSPARRCSAGRSRPAGRRLQQGAQAAATGTRAIIGSSRSATR